MRGKRRGRKERKGERQKKAKTKRNPLTMFSSSSPSLPLSNSPAPKVAPHLRSLYILLPLPPLPTCAVAQRPLKRRCVVRGGIGGAAVVLNGADSPLQRICHRRCGESHSTQQQERKTRGGRGRGRRGSHCRERVNNAGTTLRQVLKEAV